MRADVGQRPTPVLVPLIEDLPDDGAVVYDTTHRRKRHDWAFAD